MKALKELEQHRAVLCTERQQLESRIPHLEEELRRAPTGWNSLGHPTGSPEQTRIREELSDVRLQIQRIDRNVQNIDRDAGYLSGLANAPKLIEEGRRREQAAALEEDRLAKSLQRVRSTLEQMETEQQHATATAESNLQDAVQRVAKATASGNAEAINAAQALVHDATQAGQQAKHTAENNAPLRAALEAEAKALERQIEQAQAEQSSAQKQVTTASITKIGSEWDKAADALAAIGAQLVALGVRYPLSRLVLPIFAANRADIKYSDLPESEDQRAA